LGVDFTDAERESLMATRSITRDGQGREVLVGLTDRETRRYMDYVRRGGSQRKGEREMQRELHQRHQCARIEEIGIEHTLDLQNPPSA
jgi:hypothetical protein